MDKSFFLKDGRNIFEEYEYVLAATGRAPNVENMGLENTTLKLDSGVPTYDTQTTQAVVANGNSAIFIAGDAANFTPLLHEATDEGRIAGENAARRATRKGGAKFTSSSARYCVYRSSNLYCRRRIPGDDTGLFCYRGGEF